MSMSFLQREFSRLNEALRDESLSEKKEMLYAAQQAIAWALDPVAYKAPFRFITGRSASSEDCLACHGQPQSLCNDARTGLSR